MKKYSIMFSSRTGNTALLALRISQTLPHADCTYMGPPEPKDPPVPVVFVGFWTDKGSCDTATAEFLKCLRDKQVFLFGTAGFGGDSDYFGDILSQAKTYLDPSNIVIGSYMCQGKMPQSVKQRYEAMQDSQPERAQAMIENFNRALSHPNEQDLMRLGQAISSLPL